MEENVAQDRHHGGLTPARTIGLILGPLFLLATLVITPPEGMDIAAWHALGLMLLMATWWSTEAIPIPVTALVPICLIPALGIGSVKDATTPYANPIIFLFLGGFALGLAMQRWDLHKRIALKTLLAVGSQPKRQIAGFIAATAFLSMWVSNTATSIMMLPIGLSVINMQEGNDTEASRRFATRMLLAIAYAASVGGIATLIGTPPNALLAAYLADNHDIEIGFAQWMLIGVPIAATMLLVIWWWLTRGDLGKDNSADADQLIREQLNKLGPMGLGEKLILMVFTLTAATWIFQPLLSASLLPWLNDTVIAIGAAVALFLIPVNLSKREFIMDWETAENIPWGVLLLFGGGLSLAGAISSSGLAEWIAENLSIVGALPMILMVALVTTVIIFLTEVTSNTATAAAFLPLMGALAVSQDAAPHLLAVPAAIAASCAFMMPVATPPNAIVFGSGHMRIGDMISAGFALNIAGILVVTLLGYMLMGWVFGG
ncbi:MAG: anion transporter [Alteromonadaceae bacterium]|nr:anion transporter [Alteromonadaceae bacterium]MBH86136.1 anion transporter [Alteromonadaceae bacterium]|tara:strand:+ start:17655 stop:19118 length:1464 start_codon:yes stop_codon:yes gene_type:complete